MRRLNSVTPVAVRNPIDARLTALSDTRAEIEPVACAASYEEGVHQAGKRRRDRRFALLLMLLSGVFVIACIGGAWLVLHGQ